LLSWKIIKADSENDFFNQITPLSLLLDSCSIIHDEEVYGNIFLLPKFSFALYTVNLSTTLCHYWLVLRSSQRTSRASLGFIQVIKTLKSLRSFLLLLIDKIEDWDFTFSKELSNLFWRVEETHEQKEISYQYSEKSLGKTFEIMTNKRKFYFMFKKIVCLTQKICFLIFLRQNSFQKFRHSAYNSSNKKK